MFFLPVMAHNEEYPDNEKRDCYEEYRFKAGPHRPVHFVIVLKYYRTEDKSGQGKDYSPDQFPFPCDDEQDDQDVGRNKMQ